MKFCHYGADFVKKSNHDPVAASSCSRCAFSPTRREKRSTCQAIADEISHRVGISRGPRDPDVRYLPHEGKNGPRAKRLDRVGISRGPRAPDVRFLPHDGKNGPHAKRLRTKFPIVWAYRGVRALPMCVFSHTMGKTVRNLARRGPKTPSCGQITKSLAALSKGRSLLVCNSILAAVA